MVRWILHPMNAAQQNVEVVDGRLWFGSNHFIEQLECILDLEVC